MPDERYRDFLHSENTKAFEERLTTETDPLKRGVLIRLLAEEMAGVNAAPSRVLRS